MNTKKKIAAIIGASGAVGREIVRLLIEREFPYELKLFASEKSAGQLLYGRPIETLRSLEGIDLAFFAAGSALSKQWIPKADCLCIDSSSAYRNTFPLIIPEINPHAINDSRIVCSPNCTATVLLMPLFRLHKRWKAKRIVASTYQAASGGGQKLMDTLLKETLCHLNGAPISPILPHPYAFNLYPHNSAMTFSGYVEEEIKMADETRKILEDDTIKMSATCVRVPVLRAHSVAANIEFHHPFTLEEVYSELSQMPGVKLFEERSQNRFATPIDASGKHDIYVGRLRLDLSQPNTLELWAVGDQLLKGAALNAVQIAEMMLSKELHKV